MHTRIRVRWRMPLLFMIWTLMVCRASWQYYGEWHDITNSPEDVNAAKQAAIDEKRPLLILYSRAGSDCSHCKALWQGALCDGGSKCSGVGCPLAASGHPWADYARGKKIIMLYVNLSQQQDWYTYLKKQHALTFSGAYPVYALFHVKDTADCSTTNKVTILNSSNVDCIGASYFSTGAKINGVKLENTFDSFKNLYESYFAEGMETYGLTLEPQGVEPGGDIVVTAQFGASEYYVSADADAIDIPIVLEKKSYLAGAINVSVKLDNSGFGNKEITLKGGKSETTLTWSAGENPGSGNPSPKNVTVYLHEAEDDEYWQDGITERTVTLSFAEGGMVEPAAENATATIHIIGRQPPVENPYAAAGNQFSGTLLNDGEAMGTVDVEIVDDGGELAVAAAVRATMTVDGTAVHVETELSSNGWDSIDNDGVATATMTATVNLEGLEDDLRLELTMAIDKDGYGVEGSRLVAKNSSSNVEVVCYEMDMARKAVFEEIHSLWTDYTVTLNPCDTAIGQGHGGMLLNIDTEVGEVSYRGFLPDGESEFDGTASLRYILETDEFTQQENGYAEFTLFARTHTGEGWKDEWFGGVVRIDLNANGKRRICVECKPSPVRGDEESFEDCVEAVVWHRADGTHHFSLSGSKFEKDKSLTDQLELSSDGTYANLYYLVAENPLQTPGGEAPLLTPKGFRMIESEGAFVGEAAIYGVSLDFGVFDGHLLDGTFGGHIKIYSQDYDEETGYAREVAVKGILLGTNADCCSSVFYPVGYGYFMLEGENGQAISCGVKIIWGGSLMLEDEIDESLDDSIKPQAASLDVVSYGRIDACKEDLEGVLLSADGSSLTFSNICENIAVDGDGRAVWLGVSMGVALPAGEWEIHRVDLSGAHRESEPLRLRLTNSVACHLNIRPGWNLVSIPWAVQELAWNKEMLLREICNGNVFTVDGDNYIPYDGPLTGGCAYWVYASEKDAITLYGAMDDSVVEGKKAAMLPQNGSWYFGTDPGLEWRSDGMIWNGKTFVQAADETNNAAGWWFIR